MADKETRDYAEKLADLMEKVPKDKREIVAAQVIGTMQGVALAESMNQQKSA